MDIKDRDGNDLTEAEERKKRARIHRRTIQKKKVSMTWITTIVWSLM